MVDLHVVPMNDLVEHDTSIDTSCICMPTDTPVKQEDGTIRWLAVHHSLDGRELPPGPGIG